MRIIILTLFMIVPLLANAEVVDGIAYNLDKEAKTAEVARNDYSGALTVPSSITVEGVEYAVTSIGYAAFEYCTGLTSVDIPNSVTNIGNRAFHDCTGLTSVNLGNSVKNIGWGAFYGCNALTKVTMPETVSDMTIGGCAFSSCSGLTSITVPQSVSEIGVGAFGHCYRLTSASIPESLTNVGKYAFRDCNAMTQVYCSATEVPSTADNVFFNIDVAKSTLYVPQASIEAYKAASPWKDFGNILAIEASAIADVKIGDAGVSAIYTLDGKHATDGSRGILIVRQADGTTKKVLKP